MSADKMCLIFGVLCAIFVTLTSCNESASEELPGNRGDERVAALIANLLQAEMDSESEFDLPLKRLSEFLGFNRRSLSQILNKRMDEMLTGKQVSAQPFNEFLGKRVDDKRFSEFLGKRDDKRFSEFLGKRAPGPQQPGLSNILEPYPGDTMAARKRYSEFLGKRYSEFLGKRENKRIVIPFS